MPCLLARLQARLLGRQSGLSALRLTWHLDKRRDVRPTGELEVRSHRHRYCGVLAPNPPLRVAVTAMAKVPVPAAAP